MKGIAFTSNFLLNVFLKNKQTTMIMTGIRRGTETVRKRKQLEGKKRGIKKGVRLQHR